LVLYQSVYAFPNKPTKNAGKRIKKTKTNNSIKLIMEFVQQQNDLGCRAKPKKPIKS